MLRITFILIFLAASTALNAQHSLRINPKAAISLSELQTEASPLPMPEMPGSEGIMDKFSPLFQDNNFTGDTESPVNQSLMGMSFRPHRNMSFLMGLSMFSRRGDENPNPMQNMDPQSFQSSATLRAPVIGLAIHL